MFTGSAQKNKAVAKVYFDEHLSHNDYYTQNEVEAGRWIGLGGERLGLVEGQPVDREAFMRLCDNLHPDGRTGRRPLTQRMAEERRVFYDFTCSAPKSVSIMAVTIGDERILRAHQLAARFAAKELEQFAATRVRKGRSSGGGKTPRSGSDEDRHTGNVIGAEFLHNSSRALDPQLHTHFTLFNATFDQTEQRWKALQTSGIYEAIRYGTEVYRNELARRLHEIGYETVRTAEAFEIKGVSKSLRDRFSKRAKERDAVVAEMEQRLGRKLSNDEVSHAVHQTRSRKLKGITTEEVRQRQLSQMSPKELEALQSLKAEANGSAVRPEPVSHDQALAYAAAHVFERSSVVPKEELLQHALIEGRGQVDLSQLKQHIDASQEFLRISGTGSSGTLVSTRRILETELYLIEQMNAGKDAFSPLHRDFAPSDRLGPDQRKAIELLANSTDQFTGIRGLAGTGKSTALSELSRAITEAGLEPLFCAPTSSAADVLRQDGFQAITLQKLLVDPKVKAALSPKSVLILDEAGFVGTEEMRQFFELATGKGARAVLSGDTGQHASVTRGDALRILEEHSRYSFGQLTQIRRQRQSDYREVVELAANQQPQAAFERLDAMGSVQEHPSLGPKATLYKEAATAYVNALDRGRSALLVSPTWAEIDTLTAQVRESLKARGALKTSSSTEDKGGGEATRSVLDSLSWTEAQKRSLASYQPGHVLLFHQDTGHFQQHEAATVLSVSKSSVLVQRQDGSRHRFRPLKSNTFDVCQTRQISIAPGERLLLQSNRGDLLNGQLVTVKSVHPDGSLSLTDGRTVPADYRKLAHGYAVTSHASQGKTVDEVLVVASSVSLPAVKREQFYVSISRGRERCTIFTDDKLLLRERVGRSRERKAALELQELKEALLKGGLLPKPQAARAPLASPAAPDLRTSDVRTTRQVRPTRAMRPTPNLQRVSHSTRVAELFHHWVGKLREALGIETPTAQRHVHPAKVAAAREQQERQRGHGHGFSR